MTCTIAHILEKNPDAEYEGKDGKLHPLRELLDSKEAPKRHKYNAQRTEYNGQWYDSKKEAAYAQELDLRLRAGDILWWCRSPVFPLPGGVTYRADFIYVAHAVHVVDVKGIKTKEYRIKKKQVATIYHVGIEEV